MKRLVIEQVSKKYPGTEKPALQDFNYEFDNGVYGLLGPNGAGKSTLINMIAGILQPQSGSILYEGKPIGGEDYRAILGFMPQQQQLFRAFTVRRFMYYFAALKGLSKETAKERITELLTMTGLMPQLNKRVSGLSGGMKQRLLLSAALLNDPKILLLDEPTAGLDPKERMNIRNYLYSIAADRTIILATHVISDIEQIAREVIFLKDGVISVAGAPENVIQELSHKICEVEVARDRFDEIAQSFPRSRVTGEKDGMVYVKIISDTMPQLEGVHPGTVNLEDIYLALYL